MTEKRLPPVHPGDDEPVGRHDILDDERAGRNPVSSRETADDGSVAPHAGAWIETLLAPYLPLGGLSRSPRGGVD